MHVKTPRLACIASNLMRVYALTSLQTSTHRSGWLQIDEEIEDGSLQRKPEYSGSINCRPATKRHRRHRLKRLYHHQTFKSGNRNNENSSFRSVFGKEKRQQHQWQQTQYNDSATEHPLNSSLELFLSHSLAMEANAGTPANAETRFWTLTEELTCTEGNLHWDDFASVIGSLYAGSLLDTDTIPRR
ncbi:hypothetical protein FOBRF1_011896 [Fusarium oxysporum]